MAHTHASSQSRFLALALALLAAGAPSWAQTRLCVRSDATGLGDGSSWGNAFTDLQAAIQTAAAMATPASPVEVWVAAGTYRPASWPNGGTDEREKHFSLRNNVAVYGGFPSTGDPILADRDPAANPTVLSGDLGTADDPVDNCYHVFYHPAAAVLDASAVLDGVTVTGGNAVSYADYLLPGQAHVTSGGGMYNYSCSPTLTHCVFSRNNASEGGAMRNYSSSPTLTHCILSYNLATEGGAMYSYSYSSPSPILTNCVIVANLASTIGGGLYNDYSSPTLTNCTVTGNRTYGAGGGIYNYSSFSLPTVANCILWDNGDEIVGGDRSKFTYSLIGLTDLSAYPASNRTGDPLFADAAHPAGLDGAYGTADDGLRLLPGSPGVDSGNGAAVPAGFEADLAGAARGQGGAVDIGCYERTPPAAGSAAVGYCILGADNARVRDGTGPARWLDIAVVLGGDAPAVDVPASWHFLRWVGPGGEERTDNSLTLRNVTEDQVWTAVVTPAFPDGQGIVYVRESAAGRGLSWGEATGDLQGAIETAAMIGGGQVWVAAGTYVPASWPNGGLEDREKHFSLRNNAAVYGGFPATGDPTQADRDPAAHPTVLSGETGAPGDSADNCYHVFFHPTSAGLGSGAVLDGVIITGGNADAGYPHSTGGGVFNSYCSPSLTNSTISGNRATRDGGGVYNSYSSPTLTDCTVSNNSANDWGGGICNQESSSPTLTRCVFSGNSTDYVGGGMYNYKLSPTLTDCTFSGNRARSIGGGMHNSLSSPTLTNCAFTGNQALFGNGGGMHNQSSAAPTLTNCTFTENSAVAGGAMYNESCSPILTNCILWGNGDEIVGGTPSKVTFSLIGLADLSAYPASNRTGDPLFADAACPAGLDGAFGTADDGLKLLPGSPCADTGDNSAVSASLQTDLAGAPRIQGGAVDMGCYERTPIAAGRVAIGYRIRGVTGAVIDGGDRLVRWFDTEAASGSGVTANIVAAPWYFLFWLGPGGEKRGDNPLVLASVAQDQTWTAVVTPAVPDASAVVHVREGADGSGVSWGDATGDPQAAIETARWIGGGQVWIAAGTYRPSSWPNGGSEERERHFSLRNQVTVYGGFPSAGDPSLAERDPGASPAVLSGDIGKANDPADNCFHVLYHPTAAHLDASAILDGVTLSGGNANRDYTNSYRYAHESGGGMYNSISSPTLANCTISGNRASGPGGGGYGFQSSPTLTACTISDNRAGSYGGGLANNSLSPTLTNCEISGNRATGDGGGLTNYSSSPTLTGCALSGNHAGGSGGAIASDSSSPRLTNCTLSGNDAGGNGGAVTDGDYGSPVFTNCTISGNNAGGQGDGMYGYYQYYTPPSPTLTNCILWGNGEDIAGSYSKSKFTYNLIGLADLSAFPASNRKGAPLFVDADAPAGPDGLFGTADDGLRLRPGSPCIDAANGTAAPATDRIGQVRYDDPLVVNSGVGSPNYADIGAYEYPGTKIQTIAFAPLADRTYGDGPFALVATATSGLPVVLASDNAAVATVAGNLVTVRAAGTANISATQAGDADWRAADPVVRPLAVLKGLLICTAGDKSRAQGAANPPLTVTYTGLKYGDVAPAVPPTIACAADETSLPGTYPITLTGGDDPNYTLVLEEGILLVHGGQGTVFTLWVEEGAAPRTVLHFGEAEGTTNGFDNAWDVVAAAGQVAYLLNRHESDAAKQLLSRDFRPLDASTRWRLIVGPDGGGGEVTLSWDVGVAGLGREVYLQEVRDERPVGFPLDMRTRQAPLVVAGAAEFEIVYGTPQTRQIQLRRGWNAVGTPLLTTQSFGELGATGRAVGDVVAPAWIWSGAGFLRVMADDAFCPEAGHLIYCVAESATLDVTGLLPDGIVLLQPGWNLISPVTDTAMPTADGIEGPAWFWDASLAVYRPVSAGVMLAPGSSYWLFVQAASPVLVHMGE